MMTYHLAGDSTVAPMTGEGPMSGWGHFLDEFVGEPVRNLAFGGATTESFIASGSWAGLVDALQDEDTVLIQFGHNDQKEPGLLASRAGYSEHLRRMVEDVREQGATPVLCTSCERRWFVGDAITPTHGDYPNTVRDLADELGVGLINLTVFTTWLYEDMGDESSRNLLSHYARGEVKDWPDGLVDDTHFRIEGARKIAAFVARSLRALERRDGDQPPRGLDLI